MQYQPRDYRIAPENMERWVAEWETHVVPLRIAAGFAVVGAWSNPETGRFVWVLAYDGDFEGADRTYYASQDRESVSPDPARLIEEARSEFVESIV